MRKTFILDYSYQGYRPEVKQQVAEMAVNGSGIRDTSRVLKISPNTVINTSDRIRKYRKKAIHRIRCGY
nr:IS1-like element transposase [Pseudanabaena sp. Chao 1811]